MSNKCIGIHVVILQQLHTKVKGQLPLFDQAVVAAIVGVPQLLDRYVVLGGK